MNSARLYVAIFLIVFLSFALVISYTKVIYKTCEPEYEYVCPDGEIVSDVSKCSKTTAEYRDEIRSLQWQINQLNNSIENYKHELRILNGSYIGCEHSNTIEYITNKNYLRVGPNAGLDECRDLYINGKEKPFQSCIVDFAKSVKYPLSPMNICYAVYFTEKDAGLLTECLKNWEKNNKNE